MPDIKTEYGKKFEGLALTPPMGWNSWNRFGCNINEDIIKEIADAMVKTGMAKVGYQYIVIDDGWAGKRTRLGFIEPDKKKFPSGIKKLADYIHSKGLKFGIYSCAGYKTCGGYPGSRGYEYQDAFMYAKWGVDYLKYDWCYTEGLNAQGAYMTMSDALRKAGRPIVFSLCEWGTSKPWLWAKDIGHLWRTTGDINPVFVGKKSFGNWSGLGVLTILDMQEELRFYAGPDHWNDPDMLEVGNGMSVSEDRAHFSMWCMLAAPLMAGNDLRNMSKETLEILTNKEVIEVDQDPLGIQGFKYLNLDENVEVWAKPLKNNNLALCFLNRSIKPQKIEFDWKKNTIVDNFAKVTFNFEKDVYNIRDLWAKKNIGTTESILKAEIEGHDVLMLKLTK